MSQQKIKTLIVDDEPLARSGLRLRLEKFDDVEGFEDDDMYASY